MGLIALSAGRAAGIRGVSQGSGIVRWIRCLARALALASGLGASLSCVIDSGRSESESVAQAPRVSISDGWIAMGTFFEADLRVAPEHVGRARTWLDRSRAEISRLERIYSRHDPESELSVLNIALGSDAGPVSDGSRLAAPDEAGGAPRVGPELGSLVAEAIALSRATGGAFDVTIGPLVELWTGSVEASRWPEDSEIDSARERVGSEKISISGSGRDAVVRSSHAGMHLDLDGLSKGAVLDRLHETLALELPHAAALLSFGQSSVWAIGDPGGGGWRLALRSRDPERRILGTLRIRDRALSVSSSVGAVSELAGRSLSHVIDPRSGQAIEGTVEAIVVGPDATRTDAWSTAMLVIAPEGAGLEHLAGAGLEGLVVDATGAARTTPGWGSLSGADAVGPGADRALEAVKRRPQRFAWAKGLLITGAIRKMNVHSVP